MTKRPKHWTYLLKPLHACGTAMRDLRKFKTIKEAYDKHNEVSDWQWLLCDIYSKEYQEYFKELDKLKKSKAYKRIIQKWDDIKKWQKADRMIMRLLRRHFKCPTKAQLRARIIKFCRKDGLKLPKGY